ncbi:MAG TPA: PFL family protein [Anaerohalosphaeraceae bacterium]|nr:PFL family protein [Anaerohalosphaeraceae bacterium]HOL30504.1 PFL family protein [Anaerohalosphaeraceae bacterium]HOM75759.1 PFL family protein [Anaerohalosphaeraceae bacterium]HPC63950.1 PFL family protein [Anaerohalosphaeraceae bacterium]HPO69309.1 PFL family protein [Anaerohalosphaeraceae bacterium]
MSITVEEIFETVNMTLRQNFDIRTVTLGINLKDCMDRDLDHFCGRIEQRIVAMGRKLNAAADSLEKKYGIPIINRRIAVSPVSLLAEPLPCTPATAVRIAKTLDHCAAQADINFIGGFGGYVQKGLTASDENLMNALPQALSQTQRVCSFFNLGTTQTGLNMTAVERFGHILKDLAFRSKTGIGCAKVAVFANVPGDNPFMAGAHHGIGEPDYALNIGISGPGVVKAVVEQNPDCDLTELSEVIKRTVFKITRAGELIGREAADSLGVEFGIVDISLAATPAAGDSVAEIIEAMGICRMGLPGTTAALALLIDAVKKGGAMASGRVGGLSGTFIPVSEDAGMIRAVKQGALTLEKLEALTSVCSVGMDMFAIPGSTPADVISAIIADELAIGIANNKTTSVRVIPVPGKRPGQTVHFGGLLGTAPIMPVPRKAAAAFIRRKGRMPAPIQSLRN